MFGSFNRASRQDSHLESEVGGQSMCYHNLAVPDVKQILDFLRKKNGHYFLDGGFGSRLTDLCI
jgi:hypothetical protein